jgi:hypothetical protein
MKNYADKNITGREFLVGDMVYLKLESSIYTSLSIGRYFKRHSKYYRLLSILEKTGSVPKDSSFTMVVNYTPHSMPANSRSTLVPMPFKVHIFHHSTQMGLS